MVLMTVPPAGGMMPLISVLRSRDSSGAGLPKVAQRLHTRTPGRAGFSRTAFGAPSSAMYDLPSALIAVTMRRTIGSISAMAVLAPVDQHEQNPARLARAV